MRPAGIHRDISADGAGELARRVGRVKEILFGHGARDAQIGAAGLNPDDPVAQIDLQHLIHPHQPEDNAIGRGQGAAGQRRTRAARHDRHALVMAQPQDRGDLFGCPGKDDGQRRTAIGGQRVAFIGARLHLVIDHRVAGQNRPKLCRDLRLAIQDTRLGLWHLHGRLLLFGKKI